MKNEELTFLEKMILDEIVRPAITMPKEDHLYSHDTVSQNLQFGTLLHKIKHFYLGNGGQDWSRILLENV